MIICPSCGSKVDCDLCVGCPSCGARAVGPPLAKAEHELASYGRAVIALAGGVVMSAGLLVATVAALVENNGVWLSLSNILTAGEVAAWRLKWVALPIAIAMVWSGARLTRSIKKDPGRFIGLRAGRAGLVAAIVVTAMIAGLIGITVPERLRRRQWSIEAATNADIYTFQRAAMEFRELRGAFPSTFKELKDQVPDPDGTIAAALSRLDPEGYAPTALVAAASTKSKTQSLRGSALRDAVTSADQTLNQSVSFNTYVLRVPGPDKLLNTDDDMIVRDGLIMKASELSLSPSTVSGRPNTP